MTASTKNISVNLGLASVPETQDNKLFAEMIRVYNAINNLAEALDFYTGNIDPEADQQEDYPIFSGFRSAQIQKIYVVATEAIAAGQMVNLYASGVGRVKARKAFADTLLNKKAHAFASSEATKAGDVIKVILAGNFNPGFSGLVAGQDYWLSTTAAGFLQTTAPTAASGLLDQYIGFAVDDKTLYFNPQLNPKAA